MPSGFPSRPNKRIGNSINLSEAKKSFNMIKERTVFNRSLFIFSIIRAIYIPLLFNTFHKFYIFPLFVFVYTDHLIKSQGRIQLQRRIIIQIYANRHF